MSWRHTRWPPLCCCMIRAAPPVSTSAGALVPLEEQDRRRWDRGKVARGLHRLRRAEGSAGPYLPQAVIAAVHAMAPSWGQTDWATICAAYDRLLGITDSPVVRRTARWRSASATVHTPGWRRWRRCRKTHGWPARTWSPRCAPTCFGGRGFMTTRWHGIEMRWR